jgi:hypothetical protein
MGERKRAMRGKFSRKNQEGGRKRERQRDMGVRGDKEENGAGSKIVLERLTSVAPVFCALCLLCIPPIPTTPPRRCQAQANEARQTRLLPSSSSSLPLLQFSDRSRFRTSLPKREREGGGREGKPLSKRPRRFKLTSRREEIADFPGFHSPETCISLRVWSKCGIHVLIRSTLVPRKAQGGEYGSVICTIRRFSHLVNRLVNH